MQDGDFKVRKIKGRTCSPLPSAQIRDPLEVAEMERSNSLSPTSKAAAFGVKTGTSVKDSEPPNSWSTLLPHRREAAGGRRALLDQLITPADYDGRPDKSHPPALARPSPRKRLFPLTLNATFMVVGDGTRCRWADLFLGFAGSC